MMAAPHSGRTFRPLPDWARARIGGASAIESRTRPASGSSIDGAIHREVYLSGFRAEC